MTPEHVDVLIVGAGLSGVAAACHLEISCPERSYAVLEAREGIGGTWDLFRYPGIRSDSDMYTLGFSFRPWEAGKAIADGPAILEYVKETAAEYGVDEHIRFLHRVVAAEWSSAEARWTVTAERTDGERVTLTCGFLFGCTGYYRYDEGFTPPLPGLNRFQGQVVHPQHWPEDLDYRGKRVVVIGSGATAVTLVPAMTDEAAHVTMLQRSPTYVFSLPEVDPVAEVLKKLPRRVSAPMIRWKNVLFTLGSFVVSRRWPGVVKAVIRRQVARQVPPGLDVDTHFKPAYDPWDQRICVVPDGDLFKALCAGTASIVTDRIETFTETGIRLRSGQELEADLVVTATGLNLLALGGVSLVVDGEEVDYSKRLTYKGMMLEGVPNAALALGYTNASWTLKCELICRYVCRLLKHMDAHGYVQATPRHPDPDVPTTPFLDLTAGYVQRAVDRFPKQGPESPWRALQNYVLDVRLLGHGPVDDAMELSRGPAHAANAEAPSRPVAA